ncbi:MAG: hypothetical protein KIS61_32380 [Candidatus Eremiobacteraeota bacterium]|nr:hypothetical protein [Candidatus Eremiobacteraeota bacterium]
MGPVGRRIGTSVQELSLEQLNDIRAALRQRISEGLAADGQQVACLPAYLSQPQAGLSGDALVVDAGGTNVRAAWVRLGKTAEVVKGPLSGILPDGRTRPVHAPEFFGYQSDLLRQLGAPAELPLGYCFSYPAQVESNGDARLLYWTKGIKVTGVVGELVGQGLRAAYGRPGVVKVLNDTVAALLGGAIFAGPDYTQHIGLIVGTGNNMATFLPAPKVAKMMRAGGAPVWEGQIAVNLESGNFHPPHLDAVDETVDSISDNPGKQRYEKAVSGFYLPQLLQCLCPHLRLPEGASSKEVVDWADKPGQEPASLAARWLLDRSADMVAAGLSAVADHLNEGNLAVQAEGGLFWKATGYRQRVEATFKKLSQRKFAIIRGDEVNLVGAAAAALA